MDPDKAAMFTIPTIWRSMSTLKQLVVEMWKSARTIIFQCCKSSCQCVLIADGIKAQIKLCFGHWSSIILDHITDVNCLYRIRRTVTAQCDSSWDFHWRMFSHDSKDVTTGNTIGMHKQATFYSFLPGGNSARNALFDAILSGCIPVLFLPHDTIKAAPLAHRQRGNKGHMCLWAWGQIRLETQLHECASRCFPEGDKFKYSAAGIALDGFDECIRRALRNDSTSIPAPHCLSRHGISSTTKKYFKCLATLGKRPSHRKMPQVGQPRLWSPQAQKWGTRPQSQSSQAATKLRWL